MAYVEMCEQVGIAGNESSGPEDDTVIIDRASQKRAERARRASAVRNSSGRRRLIDPTTTERDYSVAETEFMFAMQEYKKQSGRMFPTWSEVLEVLQGLGYQKLSENGAE
jgi:hypothetical protein